MEVPTGERQGPRGTARARAPWRVGNARWWAPWRGAWPTRTRRLGWCAACATTRCCARVASTCSCCGFSCARRGEAPDRLERRTARSRLRGPILRPTSAQDCGDGAAAASGLVRVAERPGRAGALRAAVRGHVPLASLTRLARTGCLRACRPRPAAHAAHPQRRVRLRSLASLHPQSAHGEWHCPGLSAPRRRATENK